MARYFFQAQYRGATLTDDLGEEFATLREAQGHATVVAHELGRNSVENQAITVFVLSEHGELLAREDSSRPVTANGSASANRTASRTAEFP